MIALGVDNLERSVEFYENGLGFPKVKHNVASKEEVDQVFQRALTAGAKSVKAVQDASWGGYHGYFSDPDGHLWEIAYNPFIWIGPKD